MRNKGELWGFLNGVRDFDEKLGSMGMFCGQMLVGKREDGSVESADLLGFSRVLRYGCADGIILYFVFESV